MSSSIITSTNSSKNAEPIQVPNTTRRRSFLEYGGSNSLSNFASSYTRASKYAGSVLMEDEDNGENSGIINYDNLSPCMSPDEELIIDNSMNRSSADETTTLISHHRKSSSFLITGNSTVPQTIFNTINTLMGIGMLSLPFAFKLSGWLFGSIILLVSSLSTNITAKYLGRILFKNQNLLTYSDISYCYGGKYFQLLVTLFFISDLFGASLSLIILFSDSFSILYHNKTHLKFIITTVLCCCSFFPMSTLSLLSIWGILSTIGIVILIFICGINGVKSPGSLLNPASTNLYPSSFKNLLFSMGLYLVIYGGAPVFPELYRDMRHPKKFSNCANISFSIVTLLNFLIGASGYLMFGNDIDDSIIMNLMNNKSYPTWVSNTLFILMGVISISKLPLVVRPIITTYESIMKIKRNNVLKVITRVLFCILLLIISLLFNSFGKLMSFMGSAICYTVCLTLPLLFYLKLNRNEIKKWKGLLIKVGIVISIVGTILGTYASITLKITK
ncbi:unnamed protein product [Candida verbasci]|uniref:Amino acid transporter transmembrane domain-containing protein n=1 Tax=Candida verbasci TaxID=1227364 RepID=A0A9W4TUM4_9ASCO|nr:unnamed protein product [Candida verbasci]